MHFNLIAPEERRRYVCCLLQDELLKDLRATTLSQAAWCNVSHGIVQETTGLAASEEAQCEGSAHTNTIRSTTAELPPGSIEHVDKVPY